jgi:hypothetical protein
MAGMFSTPRPMPDQKLPFIAGAAVIALALYFSGQPKGGPREAA